MLVVATSPEDERVLPVIWDQLGELMGPKVEIRANLPNGRRLATFRGGNNSAARVRSIIEKANDFVTR